MKKTTLIIIFLFFGVKSFSTTITVTATDSACSGQYLYLHWSLSDTLSYGNFEIQSSNATGSFFSPVSYGFFNISSPDTSGIDSVYIPNTITPGNCYRFRINRVTPSAITGAPSQCIVIGVSSGTAPSFTAYSYPSFQSLIGNNICAGELLYFMVDSPITGVTYTWVTSFGNFNMNPFLVLFNLPGTTTMRVAENNYGCLGALSPPLTITAIGAPTANIVGPLSVCVGDTVHYTTVLQSGVQYLWSSLTSHGQITDSLNNQAWFVFDSAGTYQVSVYVANACSDTIGYRTVSVYAYPQVPSVIQSGDTLTCSVSASFYGWFKNGIIQPTLTTQSIILNLPADNGSWKVVVWNNPTCKSTSAPVSVVGIEELSEENFSIFPNPVENKFTIYPEYSGRFTVSEVEIYDMVGEIVFSQKPGANSQQQIAIDVSSLTNGMYFVKLSGGKREMVGKFIKH